MSKIEEIKKAEMQRLNSSFNACSFKSACVARNEALTGALEELAKHRDYVEAAEAWIAAVGLMPVGGGLQMALQDARRNLGLE